MIGCLNILFFHKMITNGTERNGTACWIKNGAEIRKEGSKEGRKEGRKERKREERKEGKRERDKVKKYLFH
jgi:hypothetical protein